MDLFEIINYLIVLHSEGERVIFMFILLENENAMKEKPSNSIK